MVRQTVETCLHGLKFNDIESLKRAFHPEAKLFFVRKNGEARSTDPGTVVQGI